MSSDSEEFHRQQALECLYEAMKRFEIIMEAKNPSFKDFGLEVAREKAKELEKLIKKG